MNINEFKLDLQAVLEKVKSIANIKRDIKIIEAKLPKIKLQGTLNSTSTRKELNTKLKSVNPKVKIDADTTLVEKKIRKLNQQKTNPTITPTIDNSQVVSGLKQAQKETKTLWERFTNGIFGINLIGRGVQEVVQVIRQAIANIKELDAIKTNIQMVSGASDSTVNAMMSDYNSMAKDLSSTTKEVAEAANEFLRMGESVASTNELIKSSQVLSKVGMIESAESASYLISSLKGYQIAAENSMDVVSKLTSVDLEAAVSAGGLAEALSKCSNIANNSGVAIDRLIGYTATVGEVTQKSMSEVGNSFQSLLSRMNNIKIGRFIDDETGESLSDTEAVLNKLGIQLRDTEDSYRSFDDVLDDIGNRWNDFTKVEQNAISVAIAGTRQRENFESLLNNYGDALKYSETAANSAGSALERYEIFQDSIQAKTNELTAAMESLSTNAISEELFSGIIEATTGVVEFIDKANILKGTLAGIVTMGVSKAFVSMATGIIAASKSTAQLTAAMALFDKGRSADNLKDIGATCKGLSDQQLKLVLSTKGLTNVQRQRILVGMGVKDVELQQTLATLGFAEAENVATVSTFSFKGALNSLMTAIMMNPIGALVTAVTAVTIAFSVYKQHQEELIQATQEATNTYKESASSIDDYTSRYQELRQALIEAKGNEEETYNIKKQLLDLQTELNDKFGDEYGKINLVTDAYKDQTEAIKAYNKEAAQTFLNENRKGIKQAEKEMTKERHYNLSPVGMSAFTKEGEVLKEIAEQFKEQGVSLMDEIGDGSYLQFSIHLNTDAQSAYDTINEFENAVREKAIELGNEHLFDDALDFSSVSVNEAKDVLDDWGDIYQQSLMAEIAKDDGLTSQMNKATTAVEEYNEAVLNSEDPFSDESVQKAKENLIALKSEMQNDDGSWNTKWQKYASVIDGVFNQADTRLVDFDNAVRNDTAIQELANKLKGLNNLDIQGIVDSMDGANRLQGVAAQFANITSQSDEVKNAVAELIHYADEYGLETEELIDALTRLGYVQGEIASSTENVSNAFAGWDDLNEQIDSIQSSYKAIQAAQEEYNQYGYVSMDTLQALISLDSEYLACLIDENGQLQLNSATYQQLVQAKLAEAEATAISQAMTELQAIANGEAAASTVDYITGNAELMKSLALLTGQYSNVANAAMTAAQAQALSAAIESANGIDSTATEKVMANLNAKLALIQNTAQKTTSSFGGLNNAVNGFSNAQKGAGKATKDTNDALKEQKEALEAEKEVLQEQKEAAEDALQAQIDGIDDVIKGKEKEIDLLDDEIDKIKEAREERKHDIELQKAQYDLERMQNQRTKLVNYVPDAIVI